MDDSGFNEEAALLRLRIAHAKTVWAESEKLCFLKKLRNEGVALKKLAQALDLSESQVSRLIYKEVEPQQVAPASTADGLVFLAYKGELSHDELVEWLKAWPYGPAYRTKSDTADPEWRPNSLDAVEHAWFSDLISEEEYDEIVWRAGGWTFD
jgi:hypothetical protein